MGCDEALLDSEEEMSSWQVALSDITQPHHPSQGPIAQQINSLQSPQIAQSSQSPQPSQPAAPLQADAVTAKAPPALLEAVKSRDALKEALAQFTGCDLKHTATNLVFSDGNPAAKVMIIGEAPGKDEDRTGVPFVGMAGQLLDQMLAAVGLHRTSVYIANILPWRPPGNRAPTREETDMMRPFMEKHIALIAPDVILSLGGTATKTLLQTDDGIMKLRGKTQQYQPATAAGGSQAVTVLPCLHPGYLLRAPHHKSLAFQDLLTLRRHVKAI